MKSNTLDIVDLGSWRTFRLTLYPGDQGLGDEVEYRRSSPYTSNIQYTISESQLDCPDAISQYYHLQTRPHSDRLPALASHLFLNMHGWCSSMGPSSRQTNSNITGKPTIFIVDKLRRTPQRNQDGGFSE